MEEFDQLNLSGKQLLLFLSVYETNSISKAAERMGLNQSTVSYGVDKLREVFGDPLFVKSGRGIVPTDRAAILAPAIRSIVEDLDGLTRSAAYLPENDDRQIVIATNVMELLPLLQKINIDLSAQAPLADVKFLELGSRDSIRELLGQNLVDVVISIEPESLANSLKAESVFSDKIVCYYDHDFRGPIATISEFVEAEHAVLDFGGSSKSRVDELLLERGLARKIKLRVPNAFALKSLIKGSSYITSMQKSLGNSALAGLSSCPHPLVVPDANFQLIWHRRSDSTPRGIWLRNLIRHRCAEHTLELEYP